MCKTAAVKKGWAGTEGCARVTGHGVESMQVWPLRNEEWKKTWRTGEMHHQMCRCVGGDEKRLCGLRVFIIGRKNGLQHLQRQISKEGATLASFCSFQF